MSIDSTMDLTDFQGNTEVGLIVAHEFGHNFGITKAGHIEHTFMATTEDGGDGEVGGAMVLEQLDATDNKLGRTP